MAVTIAPAPRIFRIKQNDTGPSIQCTLRYSPNDTDRKGPPIPLTGATVKFLLRQRNSSSVKVNSAAVIVNASGGIVRYDWVTGDTDTSGTFEAEWEITMPSAQVITVPSEGFIEVRIFDDIG